MNLSRFATRHIKAILFVAVVLCAAGVGLLAGFPVAILPEVTFPRAVVVAEAGDRPSRMVEVAITRPLEEAIATVPGVERLRSKTQRGGSEISVDFAWGVDMVQALALLNTRINEVRSSLPADAKISAERMNPTVFPIMGLSLKSDHLTQSDLWSLATYVVRPRLSRVPGVARVVVQGGRPPEVAVDLDPARVAAFRLSLPEIESAIAQTNIVRAVGRIDHRFQQYGAVVSGQITSLDGLRDVVVTHRNGAPITIRDLATVHPSTEDRNTIVTSAGSEAVLLNIVRQPDANTVTVVDGVNREIRNLTAHLPSGTSTHVWYDQSTLIGEAVGSVRDAVLVGAVLAVVVLLLFLGNLRATIVTAVIIPATVLITLLLMRAVGLTLNLMTLGALAVGVGLVIDDAIVVVENVFRHLASGVERREAMERAASEIAAPMVSSTLTTVVVFLPLMIVSGIAGAFFTALAVTLTLSLMVSLVLALTVSPSLCAAFLHVAVNARQHGRLFERLIGAYERALRYCIGHRWLAPGVAAVAIALTVYVGTHIKTGFMPEMDEGAFILDFWTPAGTSLDESDRLLTKIDRILMDAPEVAAYSRRTGTEMGFFITEPNRGDIAVTLKRSRTRSISQVMDGLRERIGAEVPGVEVEFVQVLQDLIGDLAGNPEPIEVKLFGESQGQLEKVAQGVVERIARVRGVVDAKSGVVVAGPELVVRVDPLKAGRVGLTPEAVAEQASAAMFGSVATQMLDGDRQLPVRVRYASPFRSDVVGLRRTPIRAPGGFALPLEALGSLASVAGVAEVNRENQRRMLAVTARLSERDLGGAMADVDRAIRAEPLPPGVTYLLGGQYQSQRESFRNLLLVLALAVVLVFSVMLFQFRSFTAPTVIVLVMPLSLFGVAVALWLTGTPLNVSSFMGAIMLVGIVVKNGILLLDRAEHAASNGMALEEAVIEAGRVRLRPIIMTTLTAILGLVPLAIGVGAGAEMQKPLAVAVIGGLLFSTVFTLVLAPLMYIDIRSRWGRVRATYRRDSGTGTGNAGNP